MSHGQPPPGQQPPGMQNDMYSFGQMAMPMPQMGGDAMGNDPAEMMFIDPFMYDPSMVMGGLDTQDDSGMASSAYNTNPNPTSPQHASTGALGQIGGPGGMELQQYQPSIGEENKPGAGPPPMSAVGFQAPALAAGSSQLTEFTKRRNWPAKCIEELKDLMIILDLHMRIKYVAPSVNDLTGYTADELHEKVLRELLHPDDQPVFLTDFNECIATGRKLRLFFRLRKKDGSFSIFESVGHAHIAAARFAPTPNNQSPFCQAVYMMARLYPATNAKLLDSFLEHKLEHERLLRRINELKKEEAEDVEEANRSWRQSQSDITPSEDTGITPLTNLTGSAYRNADAAAMPPPERPNPLKSALTRENLESSVTGNRPDSIRDKMARYDQYSSAANHIEMLTGLRYNDGERARGITTGSHSPTLIKGDAGIAIPIDRDPRTGDKKKKQKVAEEYVCTDCGTLDSPEWRKGPSGPKTLCNACGLRWAKREKKRGQSGTGNSGSGATVMTGSGAPGGLMPMMDQGPG